MSTSPGPNEGRAELKVELGLPPISDAAELDEATVRLRNELLELNVERVDRPTVGQAPEGARAADVVALGALVVTLARNTGALSSVIRSLQAWAARDRNRSVKLELDGDTIEVTGISSTEQAKLIETWVARHATS